MMKNCPYCREEIPEEAKVCKFCNSAVAKKCPFCAEEISVMAKRCKFCQSDLGAPAGGIAPPSAARPSNMPLGEARNVGVVILLVFVTCGIYALVHMFLVAGEINRHSGQQKLNPGLDFVLALLTCGIWYLVVAYKYPKTVYEMNVEEGIQATDQSTICLVLAVVGLQFVSILILQSELNKHWEAHRGMAA